MDLGIDCRICTC